MVQAEAIVGWVYNYLFELKWTNEKDFETKKQKAIEEIKEYQNLPNIKEIKNLYSYAIIGCKDRVDMVAVEKEGIIIA